METKDNNANDKSMNDFIRRAAGRGRVKQEKQFTDGFDLGAMIRGFLSKKEIPDNATTSKRMNEILRGSSILIKTSSKKENGDEE